MSTQTKNPAFPSGRAIAWMSVVGAGEVDKYDVLPADDWRVLKWPERFVDSLVSEKSWPMETGTLPSWSERAQADLEAKQKAAFEAAAKRNPQKLEVPGVLVCTRDHPALVGSTPMTIRRGSRALAGSDAVAYAPENWKPA